MSEGIQPDIRVTITKENLKLIPDMCSRALELGVKRIKFTNYLSVRFSRKTIISTNSNERRFGRIFFYIEFNEKKIS